MRIKRPPAKDTFGLGNGRLTGKNKSEGAAVAAVGDCINQITHAYRKDTMLRRVLGTRGQTAGKYPAWCSLGSAAMRPRVLHIGTGHF